MPRLSYPAEWENLAVFFGRAKRTSKLPAADLAKRLGDDGGRFELQFLVPLGATRVSEMAACDCGALWIRTRFGWHQACDFEIRYRPPSHSIHAEGTLRLAEGEDDDDETKPVAPIEPAAPVAPATAGEAPLKTRSVESTEAMRQQRTLVPAITKWLLEDMAQPKPDGTPFLIKDYKLYCGEFEKQFPGASRHELRRALAAARKQLGLVKPRPWAKKARSKRPLKES